MAIHLAQHDPAWAHIYELVAADIRGALGPMALSVDHVGSTAIPGILAKPVIDVLVLVEAYDPESLYTGPLASVGYRFGHRDEDHLFFEGSAYGMAVHVHVVEERAKDSRRMIVFRDYLRAHPEEARRYEDLKVSLADEHTDVNEYAEAKSSYVWNIVRSA
jgi:GrpB-like predicted nucleotidyltransferase (UPF0157 family)